VNGAAESASPRLSHRGFTLIELMLAVLLLAILASAAVLSFSEPIRNARFQDAIQEIRAFDSTARQAAVSSGQITRLVFDLSAGTIERRDTGSRSARLRSALPSGYRIERVRIGSRIASSGQAIVDLSPLGIGRTYAVRLHGPGVDQWLLLAGLTGQISIITDESKLDAIFAQTTAAPSSRHDAD
jgi:prepilin-type N-terminal cleavage/methylation domain-containing protein